MKAGSGRGAYAADRAAALSGVPRSTIHYWASHDVLVPSISSARVKFWSYTDLMGLRTISWLRQRKITDEGRDVPGTAMPAIRRALSMLSQLDLDLWTVDGRPSVRVDPNGEIYIDTDDGPETLEGARPLDPDMFDLLAPFAAPMARGPDLQAPRPNLRIVPGKLSGSPHIIHSRIETLAVAALDARGYDTGKIESLYPHVAPIALAEAVDLERQLTENLRAAA